MITTGSRTVRFVRSCTLATALVLLVSVTNTISTHEDESHSSPIVGNINVLYAKLKLSELGLSENIYRLAVNGWEKLKTKGEISKDIISICDFTQSSNHKRLYIIDLASGALLFNTLVAHGKNSGEEFARYFSNEPSSLQSSLGFYVTGMAYNGSHGLGLQLQGKEAGFNDKAEARAIVMHGAGYVSEEFIRQYGRLGKSFGCPAVPLELHEQIINTIKDGSCLFIYYPDKKYLASSKLCN